MNRFYSTTLPLFLGLVLSIGLSACQSTGRSTSTAPPKERVVELPNLPADAVPLKLVRISAGTFEMGSGPDDPGHEENETPPHPVEISNDFYMGAFEVTQAQWAALMGDNPSHVEMIGINRPVNRVSWVAANEFIDRLNGLYNDWRYRLPTEAEWEYACRAGTQTVCYFGDDRSPETIAKHAWFRDNSDYSTQPVGQKPANRWGLHDMYGNVWEWCWDWYGPYPLVDQYNPMGPDTGEEKVIRGGSWMGRAEWLRSADRGKMPYEQGFHTGGFRIVWSENCTGC